MTNLLAEGPGSLRAAVVDSEGPRTVVFRVSGTIDLGRTELNVVHPYLTIAGQTAPADGITVRGGFVSIETHDVIIRHVRFRPGPGGWASTRRSGNGGDGFAFVARSDNGVGSTILDHVSISWGTDETLSVGGSVRDVTVQNSIMSEALNCVPPPFQADRPCESKSMLLDKLSSGVPDRFSAHHNLIAHGLRRNPAIHAGDVDWVNNVVYNWGFGLSAVPQDGRIRINIVGNYSWPSTAPLPERFSTTEEAIGGVDFFLKTECGSPCAGSLAAYIPEVTRPEDALRNLTSKPGEASPTTARTGCSPPDSCPTNQPTRFDFPVVPTEPAQEAYNKVLDGSGATLPRRDPVDARVVGEVRTGTGRVIDTPDQVGGYPAFTEVNSTVVDTDHDGMPDSWEIEHGLQPANAEDRNADFTGDGYTNLEKYLNELAGDGPTG